MMQFEMLSLPFLIFFFISRVENKVVNVMLNFDKPIHEVNERFVSVAFGASMIGSTRYPLRRVLRSKKLITLASALAPAYLRLGGTAADFVTFEPNLEVGVDANVENREANSKLKAVGSNASFVGRSQRSNEPVDVSERELQMRKRLTDYWYRCGCEHESPQMSVYVRDRLKIAKRQQLDETFRSDREWEEEEKKVDMKEEDEAVRKGGNMASRFKREEDVAGADVECYKKKMDHRQKNKKNIERKLTGQEWEDINIFAQETGLRLLFDINGLKTNPSGEWNSSNAALLLRFSGDRNYSLDFQLGNEPNHYHHHVNRTVSPEQLARDFWLLRRLMQSGIGGRSLSDSLLVGPDVTRPTNKETLNYLHEYLKDAINAIDAITWHQYFVNGREATLSQFTDPTIFNILRKYIDKIKSVRDVTGPSKPIWLTETASAWGGGACGLSDRFVDGFFWLDKLGTAASMGVEVVTRQTLWKGQYGLLEGDLTFEPRPDYWLTLLFKRLVGRKVLKIVHDGGKSGKLSKKNDGRIRLYAHCAAPAAAEGKSAIALFGMNIMDEAIVIRLKDVFRQRNRSSSSFSSWKVVVKNYILESNHDQLWSQLVRLNGRTLHMHAEDELPVLKPVVEKFREPHQVALKMPAFGLAFYIIEGLEAKACFE